MSQDNELGDLDTAKGAAVALIALAILALIGLAGFAFILWQMPD